MNETGGKADNQTLMGFDERLHGDLDALHDFARELSREDSHPGSQLRGPGLPSHLNADETNVEEGLAKLVLALVDLLRELLEKQAVRRIEAGSLTDDQIERMGETFMKLEAKMVELRTAFGLNEDDLTLTLGPLKDLLSE